MVQYNLKAKNIITYALGMYEYFRVSNCKNAKEIWDTLQVTHEGTTDVKKYLFNNFEMKDMGETSYVIGIKT